MRLPTRLAAGLVMLAMPLSTFAVFDLPSQIFAAMQMTQKPMDFSMEGHANIDKYWVSVWSNGSQQMNYSNPLMNGKFTFDVSDGHGTLRAKLQMRMVQKKMYLYVESINGNYDSELASFVASIKSKQWVSMDMSEILDMASAGVMDASMYEPMDEFLQASHKDTAGKRTYTVTLKREFLRSFLSTVRNYSSNIDDIIADKMAVTPQIQLTMQIDTTLNDEVTGSRVTGMVKHPEVTANVKAQTSLHKGALTVQVPTPSVDMETYMEKLGGMSPFFDPWNSPSYNDDTEWTDEDYSSYDTWDETEDLEDVEEVDSWCTGNISAIRKGECGIERKHSRSGN